MSRPAHTFNVGDVVRKFAGDCPAFIFAKMEGHVVIKYFGSGSTWSVKNEDFLVPVKPTAWEDDVLRLKDCHIGEYVKLEGDSRIGEILHKNQNFVIVQYKHNGQNSTLSPERVVVRKVKPGVLTVEGPAEDLQALAQRFAENPKWWRIGVKED